MCEKLTPDEENEKYNLPCPYDPDVMCVQMPCAPEDDNYCDDGCPHSPKTQEKDDRHGRDDAFGPFI